MKQCPKCGKMLNDSMAFCTQCGTPLANAAAQPAPQPPQQPVWSASQPTQSAPRFAQQPTQQHYYAPANPVLNTIKQMATSPLFLAATAAQSGMVLFNIIASMAGTSGLLGTVGTYLSMILSLGGYSSREASGLLDGIGSLFTGASLGATLVGQCPAILIAVGPLAHLPCRGWQDQHSDEKYRLYPRQDQHHHQSGREHSGPGRGGNFGYHDHRNRGKIR